MEGRPGGGGRDDVFLHNLRNSSFHIPKNNPLMDREKADNKGYMIIKQFLSKYFFHKLHHAYKFKELREKVKVHSHIPSLLKK